MVKFYLFFFIAVISISQVFAQNEDSEDEYTGYWIDDATWQDSSAPATTGLSSTITINGRVTAPTIEFNNNGILEIADGDTLIVEGDLTMDNNSTINVKLGSVLVVLGNLTTNNDLNVFNAGIVVVTDSMKVGNTTNIIDAGGSLYLLGGHNLENDDFDSGTVEDNVEDQEDLNNNDGDLVAYLDTNHGTTLPVELIYFKAFTEREWVRLEWVTATEINNDYFAIERAEEDLNFQEIGTVQGNGTTSQPTTYWAKDKNPPNGQLYYRLRQVDFDGSQHFHQAVSVDVSNFSILNVYPNPSSDGTFQCTIDGNVQNVIYISAQGNHYSGSVINKDESTVISSDQLLSGGIYLIKIQTEHKVYFADVIVQ